MIAKRISARMRRDWKMLPDPLSWLAFGIHVA
jgi:hypothetical protein